MIFGYQRISTNKVTQKTDRQEQALREYAAQNNFEYDDIITERASGKTFDRPNYLKLKEKLRAKDILIVKELDRFGRNAKEIQMELQELRDNGIRVIILDMPYLNNFKTMTDDTMANMITDILVTLQAYLAQMEREKIVRRINEGLDAARSKGKKLGRKELTKDELPKDFIKEYTKYKNGEYGTMTATKLADLLKIGRSTLYKYIKVYEGKK